MDGSKSEETKKLIKWAGLVAAIWVQAFAGNTFAYANYSATLKSELELNQVELNYLALSKDFGENVGLLAGILCNHVPPWVILSIAALEGLLGFGSLWLVASKTIASRPLWQMCVAIFVGGNSMTWFNTAVLVTCMRNFPKSRGTIVGFLKGFIGLSGAIFTQIFISLLSSDGVQLLLFLAIGPTLICLFCMGFIRPVPPAGGASYSEIEEEHRQFHFIYIVSIALAIYLFAVVFVDELFPNSLALVVAVIIMFIFLLSPIVVPLRIALQIVFFKKSRVGEAINDGFLEVRMKRVAEEKNAEILLAYGEGAKKLKKGPRRGEDFDLKQAVVKADFWLLFFAFFCGVGTAVTANNNLSQLSEAQGYTGVSTFVLLSSIWGFIGRLGGGALSEYFVKENDLFGFEIMGISIIPRPVWIGIAQLLMVATHLLFAFAIPNTLHVASSLMGLCYGIQIAVIVPTISEIFGLRHFGMLYNFITLADPIASFVFSTLLTGNLYDLEVFRQYGIATSDLICTGAHCFRVAFIVMAGICVVGALSCILLTYRLYPVYKSLSEQFQSASYTSLPSDTSALSPRSPAGSFASLLPTSFSFPKVSSSTSIAQEYATDEDLH